MRPCFCAIGRTLGNVAESLGPRCERNVPGIVTHSFIMRNSCSAWWFVWGPAGASRKRCVSVDPVSCRSQGGSAAPHELDREVPKADFRLPPFAIAMLPLDLSVNA